MHNWRGRVSILAATFLATALVLMGLAGLLSQAKAAPVTLTLDQGQMSVGPVILNRQILPATSTFPSPDLPVAQRTDIELNGDLTDGQLSFPANTNTGLQFPYMNFLNPINPAQMVPFTFRLKGDGLNGTFDQATGEAHLAGNIDIIVVLGLGANPLDPLVDLAVPPLGIFGRCRIADVPVDFSTEATAPFTAARFADGFGLNGSMTTSWTNLPAAAIENGTAQETADCAQLNQIIHSAGGIWLSNGIESPPPQPPPTPPTCQTDRRLCPPPQFAEITDVTMTPRKKTVKAGKKVTFTAKVTNSGNIAAEGLVIKIKSNRKKVKVPASKTVSVPAGTTLPVKFKATVKKKARGSAGVRVSTSGWSADSTIRIKKAKKPKRARK